MRVVLLHNPSAGSEDHARPELMRAIRRAGHAVVDLGANKEALGQILQRGRCDLIAVAGGDGTVGPAALAVAGSGVPLAILPLGTANNIARTFAIHGEPAALIPTWSRGHRRVFDLASMMIDGRSSPFAESTGFGIFPELMRHTEALPSPDGADETLDRDLRALQELAERAEARPYRIDVDGEDRSGTYVLVEVMNVPFLGPRLCLAPSADPGDGKLELVVLRDDERGRLVELAKLTRQGRAAGNALPIFAGRHITIESDERRYHLDGTLCHRSRAGGPARFEIRAEPGALLVLAPEP